MAQMPVEIVEVGTIPTEAMDHVLSLANSIQHEFVFQRLPEQDASRFAAYAFKHVKASEFMNTMEEIRASLRGYHPYLLAFIDAKTRW
jgi:hypothetical protein